jgi:hypothetical protein
LGRRLSTERKKKKGKEKKKKRRKIEKRAPV